MALPPHAILLLAIVAVGIALMLIRPRGWDEFYWVDGAVVLLLALRLISWRLLKHAIAAGADVYLFLFGMMLLAELAQEHGVFEWLSAAAARGARGDSTRLFTLVYAIGAVVTIVMSNDATAVVLTPAVLVMARTIEIDPLPCLFACALVANAASFVLPLSNPANLVVFHGHMPVLRDWLAAFLLPSLAAAGATYGLLRWRFRRELRHRLPSAPAIRRLGVGGRIVLAGTGIMVGILLTSSMLDRPLGLPTCVAALALAAAVSWQTDRNPLPLARKISWGVLALVAGLFAMVYAVESIGALTVTESWLAWARLQPPAAGALITGFATGFATNLVNNLPLGMLAASTLRAAQIHGLLSHAVLIGVDLGPNLSVTGSLATILWWTALRRKGVKVGFGRFLKVGLLVMPLALLASLATAAVIAH